MKTLLSLPYVKAGSLSLLLAAFVLSVATSTTYAETSAVASRVFNNYKRTRLPDKSFVPETYAFAEGGRWNAPVAGDSITQLPFIEIAKTIAKPLAQRGYIAAKDPEKTDLLIFVFWGTTLGSAGGDGSATFDHAANAFNQMDRGVSGVPGVPTERSSDGIISDTGSAQNARASELDAAIFSIAMENNWRTRLDVKNAQILGFQDNLDTANMIDFITPARDIIEEVQASRYFVVLKAYDFRLAWKEKRRKVLWETRFSIRSQGNDFGESLAAMAQHASKFLGVETRGIVREKLPDVEITFKDFKVLPTKSEK